MIISIDPGIHIGIVIANGVDYRARTYDLYSAGIIMFTDRAKLLNLLRKHEDHLEALVIEDFLLFEHKALDQIGSRFETVKVIERLTLYAEQLGIEDKIKMQEPAFRSRATVMPDQHLAFLRAATASEPKNFKHLRAAYQHLRAYVFDQSIKLARKKA